jgi:hypothetical protein
LSMMGFHENGARNHGHPLDFAHPLTLL